MQEKEAVSRMAVAVRVRVLTAVIAALGLLSTTGATAQPAGPCRVLVNGEDARAAATPKRAIRVDASGGLEIVGSGFEGPAPAKVQLDFGPVKRTVFQQPVESAETWRTSVNVRDYARFGVGLYHVVATSGQCRLDAWVRVVGRSPFQTVAGIAATLLLVLGLVLLGVAVVGGAPMFAALTGAAAGVGALILAQQFGLVPLTVGWGILAAIVPAAAGGVAALLKAPGTVPSETWRQSPLEPTAGSSRHEIEHSPGSPMKDRLRIPRAPKPPKRLPGAMPPSGSIRPPRTTRVDEMAAPAPTPGVLRDRVARPPSPAERTDEVFRADDGGMQIEDAAHAIRTEAAAEPMEAAGEITPAGGLDQGAGAPPPDPPRSAYALLKCPDVVVAQREFELTAGLSEVPTPGVSAEPMVRPRSSVGDYILTIHVVAEGFTLRTGESWRQELHVTAEQPYPTVALHLVPKMPASDMLPKKIRATYAVDGQIIGDAVRSLAVVPSEAQIPQARVEAQEPDTDIAMPVEATAPDLTIVIRIGESERRLLWTFESPHRGIGIPDIPLEVNIGSNPDSFARQLIDQMNANEGRPGVYQGLIGIGNTIADKMPPFFWEVLPKVAARSAKHSRPPMILILSQEPHIPWELAVIDPVIDPEAPPFLAAQANVGRWIIGGRKPKLPPPLEIRAGAFAVVSGVYDKTPGWKRLAEAELEATLIGEKYGAVGVDATNEDVLEFIGGSPAADVMHFAIHGVYDANSVLNGLVLVDGRAIDPTKVKGSVLLRRPFVFLNACQVGSGQKILGDYAGMAEAFLYAGAAGLVAPLWSIKDSIAKEIALSFYEQTLSGAAAADVLRRERGRLGTSPGMISATYLAYQFFGHPAMKLTRPD